MGVSERRACKVIGQSRSTQRREHQIGDDEKILTENITRLACKYGRYGYRRITAMLVSQGFRVNHKRVERIWSREGLKVPSRQPRRARLKVDDSLAVRLVPTHRNHVWSYDFMHDKTRDGRPLKILNVIDEYTRECLAIQTGRSIKSDKVQSTLDDLFIIHGVPEYIRSDNGPEFISHTIREWFDTLGVSPLYIEPASPWENGYIESFNGKMRDELLNREIFDTLTEARVLIERWRIEYNTIRPHSSLGYRPPVPHTYPGAVLYPPKAYQTVRDLITDEKGITPMESEIQCG